MADRQPSLDWKPRCVTRLVFEGRQDQHFRTSAEEITEPMKPE
jgi:hypothetical protein